MDHGHLAVPAAGHELVAHRQHQAGHADGENQDERQDVFGERLHGALAGVDQETETRGHEADHYKHSGEVQQVEHDPSLEAVNVEPARVEPKQAGGRSCG